MEKYTIEEGIKIIAESKGYTEEFVKEYLINSGFMWFNQKQHILLPYKKYCKSMLKNTKMKHKIFYVILDEDFEATYYISKFGIKYIFKHIDDVE